MLVAAFRPRLLPAEPPLMKAAGTPHPDGWHPSEGGGALEEEEGRKAISSANALVWS